MPLPRPPAPRRGRSAAAAALALALLPVLSGQARAHTALSGSAPADGAALQTPPGQVALVFTEAVTPDLATVVVTAPDGARVAEGDAAVQGETVTQPLSEVTAGGQYQVAYRVVAADGHPVTGTLGFSVADAAPASGSSAATPEPAGTPEPAPEESPPPTTPVATESNGVEMLLAAIAVTALAVAAAFLVRRRARSR